MTNLKTAKLRFALAGLLALITAPTLAGEVTLYERPAFQGPSITTGDSLPNLAQSAFGNVASSAVVSDGTWEACTETDFRGRCAQLSPGSYGNLGAQLQGVVVSLRQLASEPASKHVVIAPDAQRLSTAPLVPPLAQDAIPVPAGPRVILYQHTAQGTRAIELTSNVDDLHQRRFENRADAAFVSGGIWRLCDDEAGHGRCSDFSPGRYPTLGTLDGRVKSAYLIAALPEPLATVKPVTTGRAVLFQYPNFAGPTAVVEGGRAPDLDWANFKYPASSVRVESGTWLMCSDIGYQGDCRVFGPGNYPVLAGVMDKGIYSARPVWRPEYGAAE